MAFFLFSTVIVLIWLFLVGYRFLIRFEVTNEVIDVTVLGVVLTSIRVADVLSIKAAPTIDVLKELGPMGRFSTYKIAQGISPSTAIVIKTRESPFKSVLMTSDPMVIDQLNELAGELEIKNSLLIAGNSQDFHTKSNNNSQVFSQLFHWVFHREE